MSEGILRDEEATQRKMDAPIVHFTTANQHFSAEREEERKIQSGWQKMKGDKI